ncbi:MAG TPA: M1 family metallopeptidase [Acidobacteriota bacterium]|nr:M1 family metallopeptidase [Acidobacteriota bacterium]
MGKAFRTLVTFVFLMGPALAQRDLGVRPTDSGGPLSPDQAAYDVRHYGLALRVDPEEKTIRGALTVTADIVHPVPRLVLDLDDPLEVEAVALLTEGGEEALAFSRPPGQLWIDFPLTRQPGDQVRVRIEYGGRPRVAPRPPWVGGFVWSQTSDGRPWVGVACQQDGADLWWPVKDHPSDEPDNMDLRFTVPAGLEVASNGVLRSVEEAEEGWRTFHWHIANPINVYNVTLNLAPYRTITETYQSLGGEKVPMTYWVLPEHYDKGPWLMGEMRKHLRFLEENLGPYPFRSEKYGVAETPYLGMEHQTIIAYGSDYSTNAYGFDWLHFHELGHEWWGNLVTVPDWNDFWIHEGLCSYMEALYAEELGGREALTRWMKGIRPRLRNLQPVAPREPQTTIQKYFVPPDYTSSDGDVNFKGSWIAHSLRWAVGDDEVFFQILRRLAYPDPRMEEWTDGRQTHFKTTSDVRRIAEGLSGKDMKWFFDVYLRQPKLPALTHRRDGDRLSLSWDVPGDLPFPMPVELRISGETQRVDMPDGRAQVDLPQDAELEIDPNLWLLREQ